MNSSYSNCGGRTRHARFNPAARAAAGVYIYWTVRANLEADATGGEPHVPQFHRPVRREQLLSVALHSQAVLRQLDVVKRAGDCIPLDRTSLHGLEIAEAEAVPRVDVHELLDGNQRHERAPGVVWIARAFACCRKEVFVAVALFTPWLQEHFGARLGEQPGLMIPFVDLEALIHEPVHRRPHLASPVMLLGVERVVAADGGHDPLARELLRIMKNAPDRFGLLSARHLT